jgi:hypothetical protein
VNDAEMISRMRSTLVARGTKPVVRLNLQTAYFDEKFVAACISRVELMIAMDEPTDPLQKLGLYLLLDSAGIEKSQLSKSIHQ